MPKEEIREQTTWNLSEFKTNIIGTLMQRATSLALQQRYTNFLDCWRQIALVIDNRLKPDEKKELLILERDIYTRGLTKISEEENSSLVESDRIICKPIFRVLAEKYAKYVNSLLKNIGMDFKVRDDDEEEMD